MILITKKTNATRIEKVNGRKERLGFVYHESWRSWHSKFTRFDCKANSIGERWKRTAEWRREHNTTADGGGKVDVYTPHTRSHTHSHTHMWTLLRHLPVHISRIAIMQHFHLLPFLLAGWVRWDAQETAPISTIKFASKIKLRSDRIAPDILDSNCSETDQRLTQIWPNIIPGR